MRTRSSYNTLRQFSTATDCLVCPSEPGLGATAEAINNHVKLLITMYIHVLYMNVSLFGMYPGTIYGNPGHHSH